MRPRSDLLDKMHQMTREEAGFDLCEHAAEVVATCHFAVSVFFFLAALNQSARNAIIRRAEGGILFLAGFSRLFRPCGVALTLALAFYRAFAVWGFD